ncbi:hypothetical protein FOVSG1_001608 [Fusarium oxysporum f. sp. vasinfectum]
MPRSQLSQWRLFFFGILVDASPHTNTQSNAHISGVLSAASSIDMLKKPSVVRQGRVDQQTCTNPQTITSTLTL